jgi:hypothetical protein
LESYVLVGNTTHSGEIYRPLVPTLRPIVIGNQKLSVGKGISGLIEETHPKHVIHPSAGLCSEHIEIECQRLSIFDIPRHVEELSKPLFCIIATEPGRPVTMVGTSHLAYYASSGIFGPIDLPGLETPI